MCVSRAIESCSPPARLRCSQTCEGKVGITRVVLHGTHTRMVVFVSCHYKCLLMQSE